MMKFLEVFIDSAILWIAAYFCGKKLLSIDKKLKTVNMVTTLVLFSIVLGLLNIINSEILYGVIKITTVFLLQCLFFKCMFDKDLAKCITMALVWYLCLCFSEALIAIPLSIVSKLFNFNVYLLKNTILINSMVAVCTYAVVTIFKYKLGYFINNSSFKKGKYLLIILIIITLALLGYKLPVSQWKLTAEFIITMLILIVFCIIGILMVKQNSDIQKTSSMYNKLVDYSKTTNKLLEDYRLVNHEHKNQLSIIRNMTNTGNKELLDYIDNLLDKKNVIKYQWIADLNNLPSEGLKGLINYKLVEMENNRIKTTVTISKEVSKFRINKLSTKEMDSLYSIIGVYLDNAIQASAGSKEKEVSLDIYMDNKELVIVLANTYKCKIDINKLDEYGYTTKGKGHGVGLHLVRKILDEENMFSQSRKLVDNYYIQELKIDVNKVKKK